MLKKIRASRALLYIILVFWAVFMIIPFAWMLLTSVKTQPEAMKVPIVWLPKNPQWKNYVDVLQKYRFASYYKNTAFVTVTTVVFQLMTCSMGAYAFARLDFPGKNAIFLVCMTVLMVPTQMIIIPRFIMTMRLGWLNSFAGIIIPNLPSIYGVFFLRQNFMTLPRELDEAAMIDGCGAFRTFLQVMLPLAKSAIITVLLFSFVWHWNDYFQSSMYFSENQPISVMLNQMQSLLQDAKIFNVVTNTPDEIRTYLQAGCLLTILPPLVLYIFTQRFFTESIERTGIVG